MWQRLGQDFGSVFVQPPIRNLLSSEAPSRNFCVQGTTKGAAASSHTARVEEHVKDDAVALLKGGCTPAFSCPPLKHGDLIVWLPEMDRPLETGTAPSLTRTVGPPLWARLGGLSSRIPNMMGNHRAITPSGVHM